MKRLAAALALEAGALLALGHLAGAAATPLPALALWAVAWAGHLAVWRRLTADGPADRRKRILLWSAGIAVRLALLPLLPHFSDDVWRYLWDGWVSVHGVNPYLHAPAAGALDGLAAPWRALVNHPEVPTIYPPGAQIVFHLLALLGPSVLLFKAAWTAADLGVACVLIHDACATRDLEFGGETVKAADVHASFMAALGSAYAEVVSCSDFLARPQ